MEKDLIIDHRVHSLIAKRSISAISRIFATKKEHVEMRAQMGLELAEVVFSQYYGSEQVVKELLFVVPSDAEYGNQLDCGKTASELRKRFHGYKHKVRIMESKSGGPFVYALNKAIADQWSRRHRYSFIFSTEARGCINIETITANIEAHLKGALYSGVGFDELAERVYAGHIMNTWCLLNNEAAMSVNGFDPIAEMSPDQIHCNWKRSVDLESGNMAFYPAHGCEEVTLIARLYEQYGQRPITAAIEPIGEGNWTYQVPDDPELRKRHEDKIFTKLVRAESLLAELNIHRFLLWAALLPEYRRKEYKPH